MEREFDFSGKVSYLNFGPSSSLSITVAPIYTYCTLPSYYGPIIRLKEEFQALIVLDSPALPVTLVS